MAADSKIVQIFRLSDVATRDLVASIARSMTEIGVESVTGGDGRFVFVECAGEFRARAVEQFVQSIDEGSRVVYSSKELSA